MPCLRIVQDREAWPPNDRARRARPRATKIEHRIHKVVTQEWPSHCADQSISKYESCVCACVCVCVCVLCVCVVCVVCVLCMCFVCVLCVLCVCCVFCVCVVCYVCVVCVMYVYLCVW